MQLNPYLTFNGDCEAAMGLYHQVLGGELMEMLRFGNAPGCGEEVPPDWRDKIMHACLCLGDRQLMASDSPPGQQEPVSGFGLALSLEDLAEAERIFGAFADGGTVLMPLQETFWATKFGMVRDRFGIQWMINYVALSESANA